MKLIIDIPNKIYNALTHTEFDANLVVDEMRKSIIHGTPIPDNATNSAVLEHHKTGKWEFHCQHWSKCSICGYADKFADKWNYCPNCGAKMENVEKSLIDIKTETKAQ